MKTVLVVDDNAVNRDLLVELLTSWGYDVLQASSGAEALSVFATKNPDLVLLDLQMPEMDGYSVLKKLRHDGAAIHPPVVAVTAFAMRGDRETALNRGFDSYLSKPIDFAWLRTEIVRLCGE